MLSDETFLNISKIIERDSKSTTYKFALLRGVIDIIQDNSPYISKKDDVVTIPLGLLVEKWLLYYYPILESNTYLPQIRGKNISIAFESAFRKVIEYYSNKGGLSVFYNELKTKDIDPAINNEFFQLIKIIKSRICEMPMKYIGGSLSNGYYSIFKPYSTNKFRNTKDQNSLWLIKNCGIFTIPINYFNAFMLLGSFISGTDNILFKWAEFSVRASRKEISIEKVIHQILKNPITERDIANSKKLYMDMLQVKGNIRCVWSDVPLATYEIDHMIPFSIWKNNDLWNLLPAKKVINNRKRDKIPSKETLIKRRDPIIYYWEQISQKYPGIFFNELQVTLLGNRSFDNWQITAFDQLLNTSKYLIEIRGYDEWKM